MILGRSRQAVEVVPFRDGTFLLTTDRMVWYELSNQAGVWKVSGRNYGSPGFDQRVLRCFDLWLIIKEQ
jgi:hypothetical protein